MKKEVVLNKNKLISRHRIFEALLLLPIIFSILLMASLLSFNPLDPSWSQTAWDCSVHNLCGVSGAWIADMFFFIFGVIAYIIPIIIIGCSLFLLYRKNTNYINYFVVSIRLIGALTLVLASCGIAANNSNNIWYFAFGGVIGSLLDIILQQFFHSSNCTLILLFIWTGGLKLFTGWSLVKTAENISNIIFNNNSVRH